MLRFFAFSKTSNARCEVARLKIHRESVTFSNWFLSCCWLLPVMGRSQFSFLHPLINLSFRKKIPKNKGNTLVCRQTSHSHASVHAPCSDPHPPNLGGVGKV